MKKQLFILLLIVGSSFNSYAQTYQELVNRSVEYLEQQNYAVAEQVLKTAMKKEPANPDNYRLSFNLGVIQQELKKYDEALISYSIALSRYPGNTAILHNRAVLFCDIDSLDAAMRDYDTILLYDSKDVNALYKKALLQLDGKKYADATAGFDRILEIDEHNLLGKMGQALVLKRQGEWSKAEELYTDLIYENRTNADLFLNRSECYLELSKLARAQEDLNKATSYGDADNPLLYLMRGQLKLRQYDKNAAREDFLRAQELGASAVLVEELLRHCK